MTRMSRADRQRWAATRTLVEVGEVMALWLEGEVKSWPGYAPGCGPAEETTELIPTLAMPVTAIDDLGRAATVFGGELDATDVEFLFDGIGAPAMDAVLHAWQVTVIDPQWGRNGVLWPALAGAL